MGSSSKNAAGLTALTVSAAGCCLLLGCDQTARSNAAESESILALLPQQPSPAEAAAWMFDQYDSDKRYRGTLLLANAPFGGEDVYIRGYLQHLTDEDASVRAAAAFALGQHGSPEHVRELLPLLRDPDKLVRLNTARAMQRLHGPAAVADLVYLTDPNNEPEPEVRAEAADALGQYPEQRVLQALIAALSDERLVVTQAARRSLQTLTGQDFADDRRQWLDWLGKTDDPFAGQSPYVYRAFSRDKTLIEYFPFWPPPPNEESATPAGAPPIATDKAPAAG